ncbi:hypothetical protein CO660_05305 [Rhizobium sp. L9]|uniref:hypothetical protein n=1 Tax=Rhizobium sp. L9 TaxID=1340738 RepID=UPI000BE9D633|nr:hypothetical protein [Rhizobium sp. L9]PDT30765.1 hypothetical protein CO660_05305 [Rhizobium sp. L9]
MYASIVDSAMATDGGSRALFVERIDGRVERFVINRSIASRGTPAYNVVSSDLRTLSKCDCAEIAEALRKLSTEVTAIHQVNEFINALKAQSSNSVE